MNFRNLSHHKLRNNRFSANVDTCQKCFEFVELFKTLDKMLYTLIFYVSPTHLSRTSNTSKDDANNEYRNYNNYYNDNNNVQGFHSFVAKP